MAKRAYYRHYRPRDLTEVMGQPHITQTLENALKSGNISHAYLFSGPRGTGKTSVARIFAHEVNDIPYEDDSMNLDIIEIDAASNRRIDEIRDLRDKIGIAPTSAKYKVYIIDEVHMLTKEAFNALLKTLEEPPEHAIFILATTEAHRLPDTILSRTQQHIFKPVSVTGLARHLALISKKEKLEITDDALQLIAQHANGSFRDGLSLLDQLATSHGGKIEVAEVRDSLGLAPKQQVENLVLAVTGGDSQQLMKHLEDTFADGANAAMLSKQIITHLQNKWAAGGLFTPELLKMTDGLLLVQGASEPEIKMTIVLLEACLYSSDETPVVAVVQEAKIKAPTSIKTQQPEKVSVQSVEATSAQTDDLEDVIETRQFDNEAWERALMKIRQSHNSLYAILRMTHAGLNGSDDVVILTFQFPFHKKQIEVAKHKKIVEDVLSEEMGQVIRLKLKVDKKLSIATAETIEPLAEEKNDDNGTQLGGVMDIMGGGEVVSI